MNIGKMALIGAIIVVNIATIVVGTISGKKLEERIIQSIIKEVKTGE